MRCTASGSVWVGAARNVDATKNGIWFSLRIGAHREPSLQKEWSLHGEQAFTYEVLETLDAEAPELLIPDLLKQRKQHWMAELGAPGLL